jgi:hypothetical protein
MKFSAPRSDPTLCPSRDSDLGAENFMLGPIDRGLEGQEEERSAYRGAMDEEDAAEA